MVFIVALSSKIFNFLFNFLQFFDLKISFSDEFFKSISTHVSPIDSPEQSFDLHFKFKRNTLTILVVGVAVLFLLFPQVVQSFLDLAGS